jgi:mannose-6-phosphate isomerase-like protein (cupin superfamily)
MNAQPDQTMDAFDVAELISRGEQAGKPYLEFLRVPALSAGVYRLPVGSADAQQPHTEDELYYVAQGRARFRAGADDREVQPGTVLYVQAGVEHRFHDIEEDLVVLVFFAPAEGTQAPATEKK